MKQLKFIAILGLALVCGIYHANAQKTSHSYGNSRCITGTKISTFWTVTFY